MHETWVFLVEAGFKVHRGFEAEGAVEPLAVIRLALPNAFCRNKFLIA
jgi:hypothetical protein